ncbi:MAG TPA: ZIP family zinc transporter [Nocardioides sp.]|mgnify:CR=1 FL=1|uniref:ZIP family metal transporter n=1 Tax=uncultured Nocardioides sp. TaxID=198441 RepID=UPI000EDE487A|nr:ZIP family zinc transporter [uncultured Nocardioides sp.]HCB07313.1 ZIP family zinc transporter [Nocardioides sp.]HRD63491.1 ZIP family zinc transporter [Nocardioides sp.]HRI96665.1 ZIP family zinc transporter [Nocardioides sp.]HRK46557.1 ZIP family zinc transporter [Nocardioides sp.]
MPVYLQAGLWGLAAGCMLVVGAAIAWFFNVHRLVVAGVMAFGVGVLFSALAFDLVDEAEQSGGLPATVLGLAGGAIAYVVANVLLDRRGAGRRKSQGDEQKSEEDQAGSGTAIAVGALLDGVPESIVLGLSLLGGQGVTVSVLAAIAISNLPEGLSSSAGMKRNGRSARYVFGVWGGIALASGIAGLVGCLALDGAPPATISLITAIAAGAILTMIADTMIPEAFADTRLWTGLILTFGFIVAFTLSRATS